VPNEKLLVQEFLDGIEYVVDSISFEGKHMCLGEKRKALCYAVMVMVRLLTMARVVNYQRKVDIEQYLSNIVSLSE
jgi:hypothetical protein